MFGVRGVIASAKRPPALCAVDRAASRSLCPEFQARAATRWTKHNAEMMD